MAAAKHVSRQLSALCGRHTLTILIAELVGCPDAALAISAVHRVYESKALGHLCVFSFVPWVAQQPWRHAWPQREDDKRQQVAHSHCSSSSLVQGRSRSHLVRLNSSGHHATLSSRRQVVEGNKEEDGARDVDKGIHSVDPVHQRWLLKEPLLNGNLPKYIQSLLEMNDLKGMSASYVDGAFNKSQGAKGSSKLVNLEEHCPNVSDTKTARQDSVLTTYPVDERPIPRLCQKGELLQDTAEEAVLEDDCVGRGHDPFESKYLEFAPAQCGSLVQQGR
jgi:hypothetical protein